MKYEIGEVIYKGAPVILNEGLPVVELTVRNTGDRTVQVCSHYHFFECNTALKFERERAYGMHLDIPSGTAVRFEPGADRTVVLVPFQGKRRLFGFAGWVNGSLDEDEIREESLRKCKEAMSDGI